LQSHALAGEITERGTLAYIERMQSSRDLSACPSTVKASVVFWLAGCTLNVLRVVREFDWSDWVMYPTFSVLIALWLSVAWFVWRGKRWAQWLLLGLVAFGMLLLPRQALRLSEFSTSEIVMAGMLVVFHVTAAWLLLTDSATNWFRKKSRNVG